MGKLYLYYKHHNSMILGNELKVKLDDNLTNVIPNNKIETYELEDGIHNIKMYIEGWNSNQLVGYIDENIEIIGDTFYEYKCPATIQGKGKFKRKNYNNLDSFEKYIKNSNKKYIIITIILIIIWLLICIF